MGNLQQQNMQMEKIGGLLLQQIPQINIILYFLANQKLLALLNKILEHQRVIMDQGAAKLFFPQMEPNMPDIVHKMVCFYLILIANLER